MALSRWQRAYLICATAAAAPFLATYRLPMADLPQHAAQVTFWKFLQDACYHFQATYDFNALTPYLGGYAVARFLATAMTVNTALKVVTYAAVLLLPLAMKRVTDRAGLDPTIALLGFPLGFGFAFYWGFFNFLLAVPLGLIVIVGAFELDPTDHRRSFRMAVLSFVLFAAHALVFVAAVGLALVAVLCRVGFRRAWPALLALAAPLPLFLLWTLNSRLHETRAQVPMLWQWTPWRPLEMLAHLVSSDFAMEAILVGVLLAAIVAISGVQLTRERGRLLVAAVALAGYLFGPHGALGQIFMYQRFAAFAAIVSLLAFERGKPLVRPALLRWLAVTTAVLWMAVLTVRFSHFHGDADGFDRLVDLLPANRSVLLLNVVPVSEDVPGVPFLHFSGYYQERLGGRIGWSFASNFPIVLRFVPGVHNLVTPGSTYDPRFFNPERDTNFDYLVVRAPGDMTATIFPGMADRIRLEARTGMWWLYRRMDRSAPSGNCAPLESIRPVDRRPLLRF